MLTEEQKLRVFIARLVAQANIDGDLLRGAFKSIAAGTHLNFIALCPFNGDRRAQPVLELLEPSKNKQK